jgi:hypothetical protein
MNGPNRLDCWSLTNLYDLVKYNKHSSLLGIFLKLRRKSVVNMVPAVLMGLYHPLDGITNPMYKLLHFLTTIFLQREEGTSF